MRQNVLITGASGVLGKAVADRFFQAGSNLVLVARDKFKLKKLRAEFGESRCLALSASVENYKAVQKVVKAGLGKFKSIDVVVNTAGILGTIGKFHINNMEQWRETINVNLVGTANICHAVLPIMVKQGAGKIINFSGGGAVEPFENFSAYASSKAAVVRLTENLAREYKGSNVQVNAVAPGLINSSMLDTALKAGKSKAGDSYIKKVAEAKKNGGDSPKLAADLVHFLATPENKLSGKLVSAKWDNWKNFQKASLKLNASSLYTLRRIDNRNFYESR